MRKNDLLALVLVSAQDFQPATGAIPAADRTSAEGDFVAGGIRSVLATMILDEITVECVQQYAAAPTAFDPNAVVTPAVNRVYRKVLTEYLRQYDLASRTISAAAKNQAETDFLSLGLNNSEAKSMLDAAFTLADAEVAGSPATPPDAVRHSDEVVRLFGVGCLHHVRTSFRMPSFAGFTPATIGVVNWLQNKAIAILYVLVAVLYLVMLPRYGAVPTTVSGWVFTSMLVLVGVAMMVWSVWESYRGRGSILTTLASVGGVVLMLASLGGLTFWNPKFDDLDVSPVISALDTPAVKALDERVTALEKSKAEREKVEADTAEELKPLTEKLEKKLESMKKSTSLPPRPTVAGKDLTDLDLWVINSEDESSTFAYYALVRREWKLPTVTKSELKALRDWMLLWHKSISKPSSDQIASRTQELIVKGGAKGFDSKSGKIIANKAEDIAALSKIITRLTK